MEGNADADPVARSSSAETRYLSRLSDMQIAATELRDYLEQLIVNCAAARAQLNVGQPALNVVRAVGDERGRAFRRDLHAASRRFERTMQATRGESFRILVVEGQTS